MSNSNIHQGKKLLNHIRGLNIKKGEFAKIVGYSDNTCTKIWKSPEIEIQQIHRILEHSEKLQLDRSFFFPESDEEKQDLKMVLKNQEEIMQELKNLRAETKIRIDNLKGQINELLKKK